MIDAELITVEDEEIVNVNTRSHEKTDEQVKVDALAEALKADPHAFLNVSRQVNGGNAPMEFVGRFPADKYDFGQLLVHLQTNYGGGDYRVMLYANGRVKANKLLAVANPIIEQGTKHAQGGGDMAQVLGQVLSRFDQMQNNMMDMLRQYNQPKATEEDFLRKLVVYKNLFAGGNDSSNMVGQVRDLLALQSELSGLVQPKEKEEGFGDLIEKMSPLIAAATQPGQQKKEQLTEEQKKAKQMNMMLKMGLSQLVKAAQKGSDPAVYAELVLDNFTADQISRFVVSPNAMQTLSALDERVALHVEWFQQLAEHVKAALGMASNVSDLYDDEGSDRVGGVGNAVSEGGQSVEPGNLSVEGDT